jgi:hypothetical protein
MCKSKPISKEPPDESIVAPVKMVLAASPSVIGFTILNQLLGEGLIQ